MMPPVVKEKVMWVFDRERAHQARLLFSATGVLRTLRSLALGVLQHRLNLRPS